MIQGAENPTYIVGLERERHALTVAVSFIDNAGYAEHVTSPPVTKAMTAAFEAVPSMHTGAGSFTMRIRFGVSVSNSATDVRDNAVQVEGGTVTNARRDNNGGLWTITIAPESTADVVVTLRKDVFHGYGNERLQENLTVTVPGPTASERLPAVSISAKKSPVTEGAAALFTLTRTEPTPTGLRRTEPATDALMMDALTVVVSVTESEEMLTGTPPVTVSFGAGERSKTLTVPTADDEVVEAASSVTATIAASGDYAIAADSGSDAVRVDDNDTAVFSVSVDPAEIAEEEAATVTVEITNGVTFAADQTITLAFTDGTAVNGTDYQVSSDTLTLTPGQGSVTATVTALLDSVEEDDETIVVAASHDGSAIGTATITIPANDAAVAALDDARLTASFFSVPPEHDGSTAVRLSLAFSEEPEGLSYRTVRDELFEVTGGTVTGAQRLAPPSNLRYELTVAPSSDAPVTLSLAAALPACGAPGSVCTADGRALSGPLSETVPGPAGLENSDPLPLTASFSSVPPEHDGSTAVRLSLAFSEEPEGLSYRTVRDELFEVTGGTVTGAQRLAPPSNLRYELTVAPSSDASVTLSRAAALPACGAPGSVCTADGRALSGSLTTTIPGPMANRGSSEANDGPDDSATASAMTIDGTAVNHTPTDKPMITGTPQVGGELTVDTSGIMDPDGLSTATFTYQWIRVAGGTDSDISGETSSTYTPVAADVGNAIKVRVSFTDDAGTAETRTSDATAAVATPVPALPLGATLLLWILLACLGGRRFRTLPEDQNPGPTRR